MLFQLAENQETAVHHPRRLRAVITASTNHNGARLYKVRFVLEVLNDFVDFELQVRTVVDTEDLGVRNAVVEAKAAACVRYVRRWASRLNLLFVTWLFLSLEALFSE